MNRQRLDIHSTLPAGMEDYLSNYGWHFSKKMAMWAIHMMDGIGDKTIVSKDELMKMFEVAGIKIPENIGYDPLYVFYMLMSDLGLTKEDPLLIKYTGKFLNDKDGYDGMFFNRFYADTIGMGIPVYWEDMM